MHLVFPRFVDIIKSFFFQGSPSSPSLAFILGVEIGSIVASHTHILAFTINLKVGDQLLVFVKSVAVLNSFVETYVVGI